MCMKKPNKPIKWNQLKYWKSNLSLDNIFNNNKKWKLFEYAKNKKCKIKVSAFKYPLHKIKHVRGKHCPKQLKKDALCIGLRALIITIY